MLALGHTNSTGTWDSALKVIGPMIWPTTGVIARQSDSARTMATHPTAMVPAGQTGFAVGVVRFGPSRWKRSGVGAGEVRDAGPEGHVLDPLLDQRRVPIDRGQPGSLAGAVRERVVGEERGRYR